MRSVGDITAEMEDVLLLIYDDEVGIHMLQADLGELSNDHDLQHGEVLALLFSWLHIHIPGDELFHRMILRYSYEWLKLNYPEQAEQYTNGGKSDLPAIYGFTGVKDERRKRARKGEPKSSRIQQHKRQKKQRSK